MGFDYIALVSSFQEKPRKTVNQTYFLSALSATTHSDLYLRARKKGVCVKVIHNASILSAVATCGLQVSLK